VIENEFWMTKVNIIAFKIVIFSCFATSSPLLHVIKHYITLHQ